MKTVKVNQSRTTVCNTTCTFPIGLRSIFFFFTEWKHRQDVQVSAYIINCTRYKYSAPENSFITRSQTPK